MVSPSSLLGALSLSKGKVEPRVTIDASPRGNAEIFTSGRRHVGERGLEMFPTAFNQVTL